MCWSYEVSLAFSCLFLFINSYYVFARPRYWKEYFVFGMFYFVMEAFQTMQWLYGDVYENKQQGVSLCTTTNQKYTIFAHILIWFQPLLFSFIGYRTATDKKFFKYMICVNIVILIFSLVNLNSGFHHNNPLDENHYQINNSIFGLSTCTNKGDTGHLVWRYKPKLIDYFPNYLMYLVMCCLSFLMYDRRETQIIGIGWLASLTITWLVIRPTLLELASSWCLISIVANVIVFAYLKM